MGGMKFVNTRYLLASDLFVLLMEVSQWLHMRMTVVDCVQSQITVSDCDVYICRVDFVQRQRWSLPVVAVFVFSI